MNDDNLFSPDELKLINRSNARSRIFKITGSVLTVGIIVVGGGTFIAHSSSGGAPDNSSTGGTGNISKYSSLSTKDSPSTPTTGTTTTTPNDSSSSTPSSSSATGSPTPDIVTPDTSAENAAMAQEQEQAKQEEAQAAKDAEQAQQDLNAANNPQESPAEVAEERCITQANAQYQPVINQTLAIGSNMTPSEASELSQLSTDLHNAIANCENS